MSKAIINAAITGSIHTPTMSPHLPITPKEIANEAMRAYEAGAAVARSNAEQVEKIGRIARELGIEPATPDEARQILGLKGMDKVNY